MIYAWYKIFNLPEFEATGLVSRAYTFELEDVGIKEILVTKSNLVSILYEDVFLPLNLNDKNPFEMDDHAIYIDANDDVFLGIAENET